MEMDKSYKIERTLKFLSIILILFIIFSLLSFIGIIDTRKMSGTYCILTNDLECSNLYIAFDSIAFNVKNIARHEINNLDIRSSSTNCESTRIESLKANEVKTVTIKCSLTAPKGNKFSDSLSINYGGGSTPLRISSETGHIKDTVR